ncbi:b(0,+)-type amino acid transporter 1-like [Anneissia japonica]|uniref:b(0,+)-type amino acid transporter 1-like n=1 Tax=Anneissia japonica TaxID=1529436 RepID=UPI001425A32E|nr:b(0,+)-type amino acid transporter 1-like [Anneissia japonica]
MDGINQLEPSNILYNKLLKSQNKNNFHSVIKSCFFCKEVDSFYVANSNFFFQSFADQIFGNFSWIISVAVALSCIGSINGGIFAASRSVFVAAREGHLPQVMSMVQIHKKTPLPAAAVMVSKEQLLSANQTLEQTNWDKTRNSKVFSQTTKFTCTFALSCCGIYTGISKG